MTRFFRAPFEARYQVMPSGCWEWQGAMSQGGYGVFKAKTLAHREAYERANGPIPAGLFVCHHCDNRRCVNPSHLVGARGGGTDSSARIGTPEPFRDLLLSIARTAKPERLAA